MKKKTIFLIGILLIFFSNSQFVFSDDYCFLKISNDINRYWRIYVDKICIGTVDPFKNQQVRIRRPDKKIEVELDGMSDDRGHSQRRFFWPEDLKDNKFIWQVEP